MNSYDSGPSAWILYFWKNTSGIESEGDPSGLTKRSLHSSRLDSGDCVRRRELEKIQKQFARQSVLIQTSWILNLKIPRTQESFTLTSRPRVEISAWLTHLHFRLHENRKPRLSLETQILRTSMMQYCWNNESMILRICVEKSYSQLTSKSNSTHIANRIWALALRPINFQQAHILHDYK